MEFEKRGFKYLYNNEYLMRLELNNIKMLLSFDNLIIRSEAWLLNRLIEWYKFSINNGNENNEFKSDFKCLIEESIDGEKIQEEELKDENKEMLNKLNIKLIKNGKVKYIDLHKVKDENIKNIIIKKSINNCEKKLNVNDIEILKKSKEEELSRIIIALVEINNTFITKISLIILFQVYLQAIKTQNQQHIVFAQIKMEVLILLEIVFQEKLLIMFQLSMKRKMNQFMK